MVLAAVGNMYAGSWTVDAQMGAPAASTRSAQHAATPCSQAQQRAHQYGAGLAGSGRAFHERSHMGEGEGAFLFLIALYGHTV